jgi:hypothetical protein
MSSTRNDTQLINKLTDLLDGDFSVTLERNWVSGHKGWAVTFTSNSVRPDKSQKFHAGDVDLRAALNRACVAHDKFVAEDVAKRLKG